MSETRPRGTQRLRPVERLHSSGEYRAVFRRGKRFHTRWLRIHFRKTTYEFSRLGLVVSRRRGNARTRNRIKRWLREVYRRGKRQLPTSFDIVLIPQTSDAGLVEYRQSFEEFTAFLHSGPSRADKGAKR